MKSGRQDSNLRPPAPKAGALTGLRHAPNVVNLIKSVQQLRGFCGAKAQKLITSHSIN